MNYVDSKGAFEEPIHGALTYHLAIKAGFTESEANQIALACAGADHNWKTMPADISLFGVFPTVHNLSSGITEEYHFATPEVALGRVNSEIDRGGQMSLNKLGVALHTLQDVGFVDALGPHLRGMPNSEGLVHWIASGHKGGHPDYRTQDGSLSTPNNHIADQPYHDEAINVRELGKIYQVLTRAAQALHPGAKSDDAAAHALIKEVVKMNSASQVNEFLNRKPTTATGETGERSYYNQVRLNNANGGSAAGGVRWSKVDSSIE